MVGRPLGERWLVAMMALAALSTTTRSALAQEQPKVVATDYDMAKASAPPPLGDEALQGKKLFVQRCALCHDTLGQPTAATPGPWLDAVTVQSKGEAAVRTQILNGSRRMPGWRHTLKPAQIDQLVTYLKTVTPDQKPKPQSQVAVPID